MTSAGSGTVPAPLAPVSAVHSTSSTPSIRSTASERTPEHGSVKPSQRA